MALPAFLCASLALSSAIPGRLRTTSRRYGFPTSESVTTTGIGTRDSRAHPLTTLLTPKVVYGSHLGQIDPPAFDPYFSPRGCQGW